jgi:hypothetical protein
MKRSPIAAAGATVAAVAALALALAAPSVAAGSLPTLTLALTKNSITVGGSAVAGAVNIVTTVSGESNDSPTLFKLRPGVSVSEAESGLSHVGPSTPLDTVDPYGAIVFDGYAAAGHPSTAQTWLQPGTYFALNNGNGHAIFTVAPSAHPSLLPPPQAEIDAIDFAFRGADALHDGELVRFKNDGYLIHMFMAAQAKNAADAAKAEQLLLQNKGKEAEKLYGTGVMVSFAGPLSHAELQQEIITAPPGVYILYCGMNAEDGREHFQLGMYRTITITK